MHKDKSIAYDSIKHKVHEKNYSTHLLDVETMVFALNIWRHYFYDVLKDYDMSVHYHPVKGMFA